MAQPVWVLSVDLQTKTATFTSGLADAAKGARTSFNDIKQGANEMGRATGGSMMEARHGVMLLGEEFGVHLPRALTSFIASIGPVGAAMEAAFPFLAIIVGATLLLQHLAKLREEGEKLTQSQINFGTATTNVLNGLNDKLLQAGIRADELNGNHLGALNKELELIDHQSMSELVRAFDTVAKSADLTFAQLKSHWYQFSAGSAGAKNSLERFKADYDALLAKKDEGGATALLDAKIQREERILALQKEASNKTATGKSGASEADALKFHEARTDLQKLGVGYAEDEVKAQETLVGALRAQVEVQKAVAALNTKDKGNAEQGTDKKIGGEADKMSREQAASQRKEIEEAQKLWEENYRVAVSALQENEKEKIAATKQGSLARLAAIDAAIKEENSKGLQETGFYKSLLTSRVEVTRQMTEEQDKLQAEAGKEGAEHELKMSELRIAAERTQSQLRLSLMRQTAQARLSDELRFAQEENQAKARALQQEVAALDKTGNDYTVKLKTLNDKQLQLTQEYENRVTQIKAKAEEERNSRILSARMRLDDAFAQSTTRTLMGQQSFAKSMISVGDQVVSGMMQNAIKSILMNDMTKESDAAAAARKAYLAGMHFPFPANIIMGPVLGALAFASVMAFEGGGIAPGSGNRDTVPAMLTPGEAVLPKRMTEMLSNAAKHGGDSGDTHVHHHHNTTNHINAIDGPSVKGMLDKHSETFERHFHSTVRKMNR